MTDIKQIYTSHQSLVGTVTPSVIRTVPFSLGGYAPSGKWYSPYNFGCYSSNQRLALACIFVYYSRVTGRSVRQDKVTHYQDQVTPRTIRAIVGHFILEGTRAGDTRLQQALTSQSNVTMVNNTQRAQCAHDCATSLDVTMVTIHSARSAHMIVVLAHFDPGVSKSHNSMVKVQSFFV